MNLDLYGITISTAKISQEQIEEAHKHNLYVAVWNTHSKKENTKAVNKSLDFIQTDKVKHLVGLLE